MMSDAVPVAETGEDSLLVERLAAKTVYTAELLENTVHIAEQLQKVQGRVNRYVRQARLIVTWKRSSGLFTMVGSAAKTAGSVMVLASPLHPKLAVALKAGHRLWKLGTGLKVLTAIGGMLRELWHSGCRDTLVEFTRCVALLSRNVGVFQELIQDLQGATEQLNASNNNNFQAPDAVVNVLREFIPPQHIGYATHVMNIAFARQHYSPLFDLLALSSDPSEKSDLLQVVREIEGFRFTEFSQESDAKALVAIGSFLHISRELLDFLDGFNKVTDKDCQFLHNCLNKFSEESAGIMKVVSLLTGLHRMKHKLESPTPSSDTAVKKMTDPGMLTQASDMPLTQRENDEQPMDTGVMDTSERNSNNMVDVAEPCEKSNEVGSSIKLSEAGQDVVGMELTSDKGTEVNASSRSDLIARTIRRAEIVANSKDFILKTFSTMTVAMEKGTSYISSSMMIRKRKKESLDTDGSQFMEGKESSNQI
ncbi:uncharacterized protein LOC101857572 [Aplysia californica]|uniref:Uncharacterized protein LOC101857572 n=1 Tax=Aplysia californica TaxID=6500 RepID=A0ABM1A120_APLCA|nr:uncharacterized protein LOC101857572 [Aplysia californica]